MIPKEAPWKTLALNERFRKKRNGEFSTATSGTERKRGFAGILPCRSVPFDFPVNPTNDTVPFFVFPRNRKTP